LLYEGQIWIKVGGGLSKGFYAAVGVFAGFVQFESRINTLKRRLLPDEGTLAWFSLSSLTPPLFKCRAAAEEDGLATRLLANLRRLESP
jgi:hypothetical protein